MTDQRDKPHTETRAMFGVLLGAISAAAAACAPQADRALASAAGSGEPVERLGGGGQAGGPTATGGDDAVGGAGAGGSAAGGYGYGGSLVCQGSGARFVTEVVSVSYGTGQDFGRDQMPTVVYGPPRGGGCCGGSLDVVSLGNGGVIVVAFEGNGIADGPGPDFVVFENAFQVGGDPDALYAELGTVAVSTDGQSWLEFPCTATEPPYGSCAGYRPVLLDGDEGPIDPATSGGDLFDLADVGATEARYVRITDRPDLDGPTGVFDLDAVGIVHPLCP